MTRLVFVFYLSLVLWFAFQVHDSQASESIPRAAYRYRSILIREARFKFGLTAPTSTFSSQIHAESAWRADAHDTTSSASGLSQFTRGTAASMAKRYADLKPAAPLSPAWSIRALVRYDWEIYRMTRPGSLCQKMKYALIGYNYGPGRMHAKRLPRETQRYIQRILYQLEPVYESAGWGLGSCP